MEQQAEKRGLYRAVNYSYLFLNIFLLLVLPLAAALCEHVAEDEVLNMRIVIKWFVFSAVGLRLFIAGIKQASSPEFTAINIFSMRTREGYVVIRELGFANIALGVMGILSAIHDNWRILASVSGGLFFGLAALQHAGKKNRSSNEVIALTYDMIVFLVLLLSCFNQFMDGTI